MEENLFPSALSLNSYKELEEERRLFYVAITRAEEHCYLSFAKSRFKYGKMEFSSPSRFLKDIDVHFLKLPQEEQMARRIDERASRFHESEPEGTDNPYELLAGTGREVEEVAFAIVIAGSADAKPSANNQEQVNKNRYPVQRFPQTIVPRYHIISLCY